MNKGNSQSATKKNNVGCYGCGSLTHSALWCPHIPAIHNRPMWLLGRWAQENITCSACGQVGHFEIACFRVPPSALVLNRPFITRPFWSINNQPGVEPRLICTTDSHDAWIDDDGQAYQSMPTPLTGRARPPPVLIPSNPPRVVAIQRERSRSRTARLTQSNTQRNRERSTSNVRQNQTEGRARQRARSQSRGTRHQQQTQPPTPPPTCQCTCNRSTTTPSSSTGAIPRNLRSKSRNQRRQEKRVRFRTMDEMTNEIAAMRIRPPGLEQWLKPERASVHRGPPVSMFPPNPSQSRHEIDDGSSDASSSVNLDGLFDTESEESHGEGARYQSKGGKRGRK